jgi:nicotinate phosphoribosyltransferase
MGVTPRLVFLMRQALNDAWQRWDLPEAWVERARQWCHEVKILVTGGFDEEVIRRFEALAVPADMYGVGSSLFSNSDEEGTNNDFTCDLVRVRIEGEWYDMAKVGRQPGDNPDLQPIVRAQT